MRSFVSWKTVGFAFGLALIGAQASAQVVQPFATGLRSPIKLLAQPEGQLIVVEAGNGPNTATGSSDQYYVLEYSRAFLADGPGRLIRVDGTRGTSVVLADPLQNATSIALDTRSGDLFVTELRANRIVKVLVPR